MSRTYRRTNRNGRYLESTFVDAVDKIKKDSEFDFYGWYYKGKYSGCTPIQIHQKQLALLHADSEGYGWNAPAHFRRSMNRELRRRQNQQLVNTLKNGTEENLTLHPFVKNVNWYWF